MRSPRLSPTLLACAIALGLCPTAAVVHAQAAEAVQLEASSGAGLSGRVREAARNYFLEGARVKVDGRVVSTDREGRFRLDGLAPGSYTVQVDFVGYAPQTFQIDLADGRGIAAEVRLTSTAGETSLNQIEVRATRESQALALNLQRSSENYKNVVSADLLGRFPDANLAESTQRIPGVSIERDQGEGRYVNVRGAPLEFTSVSVDGVPLSAPNASRRTVELDTIPADVISALEVTKALTPDMDGDAIAGQINIVTQSALDRDGTTLRASAATGRYELGDGDNDRASVTVGTRFGEAGNLGLLVAASGSRAGRFTDNVETEFFRAEDGRILPDVTEIKDYEGQRTRTGLTARFDARINEDHLLYAIGTASKYRDKEYRNTLAIVYERHDASSSDTGGVAGRATFDKELRERIQEQRIRTLNLGGEHYLGDNRIDWQASRSQGKFDIPARQQWIFRSTLRPPLRYDFSDSDFPVWTLLNSDGSVRQQGINLPENVYAFRRYNQRLEDAEETETGLRLDLQREQNWLGESGAVKVGVRARLREKDSNDDRRRNTVAAGTTAYADLLCPRVSNNFGRFEFGRVLCNDIFERFGGTVQNANLRPLLVDSTVNDYSADEDIYATYARLDARWNALSLVGGLRFERTETSGQAFLYDLDEDEAVLQEVGREYNKLLPSLHLRYEFDTDSILRGSYSTGLSRPNYTNTVPRFVISDDDREAEAGNPNLKATYSQNVDVSFERYLRPLGLLSVAAFHKRLDDPIFVVNSILGSGDDALRLTRAENGKSGSITGLELAWQQTFDRLPSPFDGLGVYANYTYADSEAELPFGIGKTDLPGTSRDNMNLAVFFEKYGFNARLAYNMRSKYIQEFDVSDRDFNVFWDERALLDFSASYQVGSGWQVFGEVSNITDSKQRRFQGQRNRVLELEQFGRSWLVGLRYEY